MDIHLRSAKNALTHQSQISVHDAHQAYFLKHLFIDEAKQETLLLN